jgi:hypothetical protein
MQSNHQEQKNSKNEKLDKYVLKGMLAELGEHLTQAGILFTEINKRINSLEKSDKSSVDDDTDFGTVIDQYSAGDDANTPISSPSDSPVAKKKASEPDYSKYVFKVSSETSYGESYDINYYYGTCSCPHFKYSGPRVCKHLKKVYDNPSSYGLYGTTTQHYRSVCDKYNK